MSLSEEQISDYRKAFQLFDKNGDDTISGPELGMVLCSFGMNPSEAELCDMVNDLDKDGNGMIDFEEFLELVKNLGSDQDDLLEAFKVFDSDGNGVIDREELNRVMFSLDESLSKEELNAMIKEADIDGSGTINFEEFKLMMGVNY
ncbi:hypothetical protein G6F56_010426 [Rhizopus delemar]|uniref:EF-hand domain-containing protein n=1 Tax=Rhizopus stolonifer TaxID=4846 RepID=A0A367JLW8_RHIST|nr:hypothetical protein G6F56_010426 [Rhizopus delemar]RCH90926.1 hypothetical protein CU098_009127 [Rhizopus stolonifer]